MTNQTLSELLLLLFLVIACSRIFFIKNVRSDPLALLPLIALILSVCNIFAWGVSIPELAVCLLCFFVTIWNFRALLRLNGALIIDHYSIRFILISILNLILALLLAAALFMLRPVRTNLKKFGVTKETRELTGSFSTGFTAPTRPFEKTSAFLTTFRAQGNGQPKGTVLLVPNECATAAIYEPFCAKLARDGWTVHAAEFYADDAPWLGGNQDLRVLRRLFLCLARLEGEDSYAPLAALRTERLVQAFRALLELTSPAEDDTVFLVCDGGTQEAFFQVQKESSVTDGSFDLSDIASYPTKGYGPVEQTDPLLAAVLGQKRDGSLYMASHIATVLEEHMQALTGAGSARGQE